MLFRLTILISFLCISANLCAQTVLTGKIVDDKNGKPLQSASIYINNSSTGTSSKEDGSFSLQANNWEKAELVVTCVGYKSTSVIVNSKDINKILLISLKEKALDMQPVLVMADFKRRENLKIFKEYFLGITEEGVSSTISNEDVIYFVASAGGAGSFTVKADEPIEVINSMLGYKIYFDLLSFEYDPVAQTVSFYGHTKYESLGEEKKYAKKRAEAYYGSSMHFFRSLADHDLKRQGFSISEIEQSLGYSYVYPVDDTSVISLNEQDSSINNVYFPQILQVVYAHETNMRSYLSSRVVVSGFADCRSQLSIKDSSVLFVRNDGILLNPENVITSGYWSYEKVANFLPMNYIPDEQYQPKWMKKNSRSKKK